MPTSLPRPASTARLLLGAGLVALPLALAAQAPATPENARILVPSVSNEAPRYGGKAVIASTTGPVSPARTPMDVTPLPAASGPTSLSTPGTTYGTGDGVVQGGIYAPPPAPLPVPDYGYGTPPPAPVSTQPYTQDVVVGGDVLTMPDGGTVTTVDTVRLPANVPRKGASMAQVRSGYGEPQSVYKTGGGSRAQPPITRWTYPGFNVVFEYTHVVDVVVPGAPAPLVRTGGLSRVAVNPANPKYKGTPGRALRTRR